MFTFFVITTYILYMWFYYRLKTFLCSNFLPSEPSGTLLSELVPTEPRT